MSTFSVAFKERDFTQPLTQPQLEYVVERYSFSVRGGPKEATIIAYGNANNIWRLIEKLRQPIEVHDYHIDKVWWGYVAEVEIRVGSVIVGVSLDDMYNSIKVVYTSSGERFTTTSATNQLSIDEYGTKEHTLTLGDSSSALADQKRDTVLEKTKYPIPSIGLQLVPGGEGGGGSLSARITCRGWHDTLKWQYYAQSKGLIAYTDSGTGQQKLSVSYTASTIYFSSASFGSNEDGSQRHVYKVKDTASGLKAFDKDDIISISGSSNPLNDGTYHIKEGTRLGDNFTVEEALINTASNSGSFFTVTTASKIIQSFKQTTGSTFNVHEGHVRLQRIGDVASVGGSGVILALYNDSSGSISSSQIASGSITASNIGENMVWTQFTLDASTAIANNTQYWLEIKEAGIPSGCAYYRTDVNEELGYTDGAMEIWSGSAYHSRVTDADLSFKVIGKSETTTQLTQIIQNDTEFFQGVLIDTSSSIMSEQWRRGETTALVELEKLLAAGTTNGRRLLFEVTPERYLRVYEEPAKSASSYYWTTTGNIVDGFGNRVPKQKATVGIWVKAQDLIPGMVDLTQLSDPSVFFIEENEYFVQSEQLVPTPRGYKDPFDIGIIEEG